MTRTKKKPKSRLRKKLEYARDFVRYGVAFYFGDVNRAPIHVIAWRLFWWLPMLFTKFLFLVVVAIGWGPSLASRLNRNL